MKISPKETFLIFRLFGMDSQLSIKFGDRLPLEINSNPLGSFQGGAEKNPKG